MQGNKQSGSALLLSLMVLALISGIATSILLAVQNEQSVVKRIQNNALVRQQLLGGEAWAWAWFKGEGVLAQENRKGTSLEQRSLMPGLIIRRTFDTDVGQLDVRIYDLQACLNVNALSDDANSEITRQRLVRLSKQLGVDVGWIDVVKDWIDKDQALSSGQGREDAYYQSKEEGYRTASAKLFSMSEFVLLDIPQATFARLAPYLCALPNETTKININTVSKTVLKSMLPTLSVDQLTALDKTLQSKVFSTADEFLKSNVLKGVELKAEDWSAHSDFVSAYIKLTMDGRVYWLHSLLRKNKQSSIWIYSRSFAPLDEAAILKLRDDK
ncbi:Putative type II secretion system protein K [Marinomonas spartinae]|uniref:Type II secretion system protein K n=1 Tax=Marinomonas spartinae TaxID=1792290 RepID=A0A1A8TT00_9GAMM|nr:type II secretion system minor pseudopilin GspK [Marinomonas spartinae]SBS35276.1 Putative type II secretion system protein K [Marinomonas spartinae]SBS37936.1 Putative type II secretion system protein K [Marinomonas spartinae]